MNSILHSNQFGQVSKTSLGENLEALDIKHNHCSARISLHGGQVLTWQPTNQENVFWLSEKCDFVAAKAIRGGIPLCWPWFGGYTAEGQPASNHGFARQQQWQLESVDIEADSVKITLAWQGVNTHSLWPNACHLKQELSFGASFSQTLYMTNDSDVDCQYTGALHSYFHVSEPSNVTVDALATAKFDDQLTAKQDNPPQLLENCIGPIDRIYHSDQTIQLVDKKWQRVIEVESFNTKQWVLWNPGVSIAETMSDVHENGEQEFVCLEAANTKPQVLKSGQTCSLGQFIRILPL